MIYIKILFRTFIIVILFEIGESDSELFTVIKHGGYTATFCLNYTKTILSAQVRNQKVFNCSNSGNSCNNGFLYLCPLPCNFTEIKVKIYRKALTLALKDLNFQFEKMELSRVEFGSNLSIITIDNKLYMKYIPIEEISIEFSEATSIVPRYLCSNVTKDNNSLICTLQNKTNGNNHEKRMNVTISYGNKCRSFSLGEITLFAKYKRSKMIFYWIGIAIFLILSLMFLILYFWNKKHQAMNIEQKEEMMKIESKVTKTQNKAFIEYQNAVESFGNLGRLTPRHVLSFQDYISRIFNLDLKQMGQETLMDTTNDYNNAEFSQNILLDSNNLIQWIVNIEKNCRGQERNTVSSLLTIVLFQHPDYFLKILKTLLQISATKLKERSEEEMFFRKSDSIVEKLIGNWISICMYQNLKTNEIGRKFFNLYRATKCKIESGLMDLYTKKVEYALTFDHVMVTDLEYEKLEIKVAVSIYINHMDSSNKPLHITMENHYVEVLSLDSISQVKEKILDSIIMSYACQENLEDDRINYALALTKEDEFNLFHVSETTNSLLQDIDSSSLVDRNISVVNTMKHYNIKSEMGFIFLPTMNKLSDNLVFKSENKSPPKPVHLQLPADANFSDNDKISLKELERKLPGQPFVDEFSKENYLICLLGIKKTLSPFIDGLFQCLMNFESEQLLKTSSNSLFKSSEMQISCNTMESSSNLIHGNIVSKELYLCPIYYLFSVFDNVAQSLSINNANALKLWKSNSFILRFWVNLIKNPNFIFCVDISAAMNDSLTTIATALMDSCSVGTSITDINTPVVKQLFLEDIKRKYSQWWDIFANSTFTVNEEEIISIMQNIIKVNCMEEHYQGSIKRLEVITNNLSKKAFSSD